LNTQKIGVKHLNDYIIKRRECYEPLVTAKDNKNYMMLAYYRNPLNQLFFTEGVIVVSLNSCGNEAAYSKGVHIDELFFKSCFLSGLLVKEEVQKDRINEKNRAYFNE
jgi:hypothetical protein